MIRQNAQAFTILGFARRLNAADGDQSGSQHVPLLGTAGHPVHIGSGSLFARPPRPDAAPPGANHVPHWNKLPQGRQREFGGGLYDPAIVKRIYHGEVFSWEHSETTSALRDIARRDAWEEYAVPPIELAYSEAGMERSRGLPRVHYAVVDGHHRLAAAFQQGGVPAMVVARWNVDEPLRSVREGPSFTMDNSLPRKWNLLNKPLTFNIPELAEKGNEHGRPHLKLVLPGHLATSLTLGDIAERLNDLSRPNEFLASPKAEGVELQLMLEDIVGEGKGSRLGTLTRSITLREVDRHAADWRDILKADGSLRQAFGSTNAGSQYPLLEVRVRPAYSYRP